MRRSSRRAMSGSRPPVRRCANCLSLGGNVVIGRGGPRGSDRIRSREPVRPWATTGGGSFGYPGVVIIAAVSLGDTISRVVSDDLSAETGDGIGSQHLRSMVTFAPCSAIFTVDCRDAVLRAPLNSEQLKLCGWPLSLSFLIHVLQAVSATFRLGRHTTWTASPVGFCDHV